MKKPFGFVSSVRASKLASRTLIVKPRFGVLKKTDTISRACFVDVEAKLLSKAEEG